MNSNKSFRPLLIFTLWALGALLALAPTLVWETQLSWLPAMLLISVLGWRRDIGASSVFATFATLVVLTASVLPVRTNLSFETSLLPLAALWFLALAARRSRPRITPPAHGRFEAILEHSELITLVIDGMGCASYANPAFLRLANLTLDSLIDQDAAGLFYPEDQESLREQITTVRKRFPAKTLELPRLRLSTRANQTVYLQARLTLITRGSERGSLILNATEVTDRVRAESALAESEQKFVRVFEHAPIGMMLIQSESGRIDQVNRMLCQLLGHEEADLIGSDPLMLLPEEERAAERQSLFGFEANGDTPISGETRYLRRDNRIIWVNRQIVLQRQTDGTSMHLIVQITDITDLKHSREQMEQLAFYDTLTGLANRRLFTDRLHQALRHTARSHQPIALMYLDLDNFKRVNDSLGHDAGDALLRTVAARLQACVRKEDTVSRLGGDEFTILLNETRNGESAGQVARKVLAALAEPIVVASHELRVTTSIGLTLAPGDGTDPQTLMKNADLAMYRAKETGRDNYQFYSRALNTRAMDRLTLENDLRTALAEDQFELYYQPQIVIETGAISGLEALLRWHHPARGLLLPDAFIQIAEESGLIAPIGLWVARCACEQIKILRERVNTPIQVAINISARQFADPKLPEAMQQVLSEVALDPSALEIEITETMLAHDIKEAIRTLEALHSLGVSLAVDDFGTGYSSLNYLKRLPIDRVKVDKTFVSAIPNNEDDLAITSAVIAMAHQLKLSVVAEGVETRAQLEFLSSTQCDLAQGHLFGQAVPYSEVERLVITRLEENGASKTS